MTTPQPTIITIDGTPVWITGSGPTIILVHGVIVDHRMWAPQVEALSKNYRVCSMDMLGHGSAPNPDGERILQDFVDQVDEVVETITTHDKPVLGGFSMGGLVAQAYAVKYHKKLAGLMLMNTVHDRSADECARVLARYEANVADGVDNAVASGARRWFKPRDYETHAPEIEELLGFMRDGNFAAKCKAHRVFVSSDSELTGKLGVITCPTLVMTGDEDAGSTPAMSTKMAKAIPHAELQILDGQHHIMTMLDVDRVNKHILNFLPKCF